MESAEDDTDVGHGPRQSATRCRNSPRRQRDL
jgi:hypothetical protein